MRTPGTARGWSPVWRTILPRGYCSCIIARKKEGFFLPNSNLKKLSFSFHYALRNAIKAAKRKGMGEDILQQNFTQDDSPLYQDTETEKLEADAVPSPSSSSPLRFQYVPKNNAVTLTDVDTTAKTNLSNSALLNFNLSKSRLFGIISNQTLIHLPNISLEFFLACLSMTMAIISGGSIGPAFKYMETVGGISPCLAASWR